MCVSHFLRIEKFLIENGTGYNFCVSNLCDLKEVAKKAKIRLSQKLPDGINCLNETVLAEG